MTMSTLTGCNGEVGVNGKSAYDLAVETGLYLTAYDSDGSIGDCWQLLADVSAYGAYTETIHITK